MITGTSDLDGALSVLDWSPAKGSPFLLGNIISAIITFVITGFVLFLVVKRPIMRKTYDQKKKEVVEDKPTAEDYLSDIRDLLAQQTAENNARPTAQATSESTDPKA